MITLLRYIAVRGWCVVVPYRFEVPIILPERVSSVICDLRGVEECQQYDASCLDDANRELGVCDRLLGFDWEKDHL